MIFTTCSSELKGPASLQRGGLCDQGHRLWSRGLSTKVVWAEEQARLSPAQVLGPRPGSGRLQPSLQHILWAGGLVGETEVG